MIKLINRQCSKIDTLISAEKLFISAVNAVTIQLSSVEGGMHMPVEQRIRMCLLIDKMENQKDYSKKLGLENITKFHGKEINGEEESREC